MSCEVRNWQIGKTARGECHWLVSNKQVHSRPQTLLGFKRPSLRCGNLSSTIELGIRKEYLVPSQTITKRMFGKGTSGACSRISLVLLTIPEYFTSVHRSLLEMQNNTQVQFFGTRRVFRPFQLLRERLLSLEKVKGSLWGRNSLWRHVFKPDVHQDYPLREIRNRQ